MVIQKLGGALLGVPKDLPFYILAVSSQTPKSLMPSHLIDCQSNVVDWTTLFTLVSWNLIASLDKNKNKNNYGNYSKKKTITAAKTAIFKGLKTVFIKTSIWVHVY